MVTQKNKWIQVLRAVLFLCILAYHLELLSFGWMCIEVFFCISGFFTFNKLFTIEEKDEFNAKQCWSLLKSRITRLYFPYYLLLLVGSTLLLLLINAKTVIKIIPFFLCFQNIEWAFWGVQGLYTVPHTWTVAIEVQVTLFVYLLAIIIYELKCKLRFRAIPYILIALSVLFGVFFSAFGQDNLLYSLFPFSHLFAFGMGG